MNKYNWYEYGIYEKDHYLSNNQYCKIIFTREWDEIKGDIYEISFYISDNKENENSAFDLKSTGKCGLEGLLWAKHQIINFEKLVSGKGRGKIICGWADDKRKRAYIYALNKIGFIYDENKNHLYKIINKKE